MNYKNTYKSEVQKRLKPISDSQILTLDEIKPLPAPVQKYLIYAGVVGKPMIQNVRVVWSLIIQNIILKIKRKSSVCQMFESFLSNNTTE